MNDVSMKKGLQAGLFSFIVWWNYLASGFLGSANLAPAAFAM
jgi:hypothetical protein